MAQHSSARQQAVNRNTGEVMQLELFGNKVITYDWSPYHGRHINVCKALMQAIWRADSGYKPRERDVFAYFLWNSPEGFEPLRKTYAEIATDLGVGPAAVSKAVGKLNKGGLLLAAETVGRVSFYRVNPRAAYDGPAADQREATQHARHPVVPAASTKKEAS